MFLTALGLVALTLSAPIRNWTAQRSEIAALEADISRSEERVAELQTELDRWADPAYVASQARSRLHYALPGEVSFVVVDDQVFTPEQVDVGELEGVSGWSPVLWASLQQSDSGVD